MRFVIGTLAALLIVALAASNASAQGCGCGGEEKPKVQGETIEVVDGDGGKTVIVDRNVTIETGQASGEDKCGGSCADDGKCHGDGKCGGSCGGDGKCGCPSCTDKAIATLRKQSKELTKKLRGLQEAGDLTAAKKLAAEVKLLRKKMAELKKAAKSAPKATLVRDAPAGKAGTFDLVELVEGETRVALAKSAPANPGFLGIHMEDGEGGVTVTRTVEGSPAARAGLSEGDRIASVNDTKVQSSEQLRQVIGSFGAGTPVRIELRRGDLTAYYQIRLGKRPTETAEAPQIEEVPATPLRKAQPRATSVRRAPVAPSAARRVEAATALRRAATAALGARQEQVVTELSRKLAELRVAAQKALADGQYGKAAELSMAAQQTTMRLEAAKKELAAQRARRKQAEADAADVRAAAMRAGTGGAGGAFRSRSARRVTDNQAAESPRIASLERRLAAMDARLQRIERLLQRIAEK